MTAASSLLSVLAPLGLAVVAPGVLLIWGVRHWDGRSRPPTCAVCSYDVSHRPPGVDRCSECGADLSAPGAIRTRERRVRRPIAIPAALILVVAALSSARAAHRFPWRGWVADHAKASWVEALARRDHSADGDVYRWAWKRRDPSPAFYDHLLGLQADPASSAWTGGMASPALWWAFVDNKLSPFQVDRMARQMCGPLTYQVRTPIHVGDPLVVRVTEPAAPKNFNLFRQATFAARLDGTPNLAAGEVRPPAYLETSYQAVIPAERWCPNGVSVGHHRVNVAVERRLLKWDMRQGPAAAGVLAVGAVDVDLLPASAALASPRPDPSRADAVARSIEVHMSQRGTIVMVALKRTDVDRAFAVYAVTPYGLLLLGRVTAAAGASCAPAVLFPTPVRGGVRLPFVDQLTVVLEGDPASLAETLTQRTYWPGEVTFPDVPAEPLDKFFDTVRHSAVATTRPYRVEPGQ